MPEPNKLRTSSKGSRREFLRSSTAAAAAVAGGLSMGRAAGAAAAGRLKTPRGRYRRGGAGSGVRSAGPRKSFDTSRGCPAEIRSALSGPWPSINTPFDRRGNIDFDALRRHLDFLIQAKAKAIVLTWGDSLYSILTDDEIAQVTKAVVQHVNKRAFVVAADNSWWTGKVVEFAGYCVELGVDMLMVMPPDWAHSTTVESLVAHYGAVAERIPVMLVTNYLGKRGQAFGLELVKRLRDEVPELMALKDDVCGEFIRKVCLLTHDRWALSAGGQQQNHMNMYPYGVDGFLSLWITFKPEIAWKYWNAIEAGDLPAARAVIRDYDIPLFDHIITSEGSFDAAVHGIFELAGLTKRYRRPPYHSLTDEQMRDLAEFLEENKFL